MPNVLTYHRPETIEEALALLARAQPTVVLAGGSHIVPSLVGAPTDVVDLQSVGLRRIRVDGTLVVIGAMATFGDLAACDELPVGFRELARREVPSTLRNIATVGGLVASGDPDSELLASMLALNGTITIAAQSGLRTIALADQLASKLAVGEIIVHIAVDRSGTLVSERTVRTGMDRAIVAVVGALAEDGAITLAVTGMAATPKVFVDFGELVANSDFRGSSSYRSQLAAVLTARVLKALGAHRPSGASNSARTIP